MLSEQTLIDLLFNVTYVYAGARRRSPTSRYRLIPGWRRNCSPGSGLLLYNQPDDWVFASTRKRGKQPYSPDSLLKWCICPATAQAKITKHIGWHTFRRTFSSLLKANGEDLKTVQELLRHATVKMTLEVYTQAVTPAKRNAQLKMAGMLQAGVK